MFRWKIAADINWKDMPLKKYIYTFEKETAIVQRQTQYYGE